MRFYKPEDKAVRWEPRTSPRDSDHFVTVLDVEGWEDRETATYAGPFYMDFDGDSARKDCENAVSALNAIGIPDESISLWASGKKGYHLEVPMGCFTEEERLPLLPIIYREFAKTLRVKFDPVVYSMGRGRMWRLPNRKRSDTGTYKVQITRDELRADYATLVSEPRPLLPAPRAEKIQKLEPYWKRACAMAKARSEEWKDVVVNPEVKELLNGGLPPCGNLLVAGRVKADRGFNSLSVQFQKLLNTFGGDRNLVTRFARNNTGDNYDTEEKRIQHVLSARASSRGYGWSCSTILAVLEEVPCARCPVLFLKHEELMEEDEVPVVKLPAYLKRG